MSDLDQSSGPTAALPSGHGFANGEPEVPSAQIPAESTHPRVSLLALAAGMSVIYVVWGSTYFAIKIAIHSIPPFLMAGSRFLIAGAILLAWCLARGERRPGAAVWRDNLILGALLLLGGNGLVTWAEQWVPSGVAALIITTTPLWLLLFDWLIYRARRPHWWTWLGIGLGFAGVALLIKVDTSGDGQERLLGIVAMVAAPMIWALGSMRSRHRPPPGPPLVNTALQMLCGGGLMMQMSLLLNETNNFDLAAVSTESWLAYIYLVTFGSLLAFTTYMWLLRVAPARLVATYAYVNPIVAVLLGAGLGGEALSPGIWTGAALILCAVAMISWKGKINVK